MSLLTFASNAGPIGYRVYICEGCGTKEAHFNLDRRPPQRCTVQWGDRLPCGGEYALILGPPAPKAG